MSVMDIEAEREKIQREIAELERSLGAAIPSIDVDILNSGSEDEADFDDGNNHDFDVQVDMEVEQPSGGNSDENEDSESDAPDVTLPQTSETCLQMNLVYQEVIQEKIEEINLLLAQNKKQQEKLTREVCGTKGMKSSDGKALPANTFLGHFLKPYFKDKTSGIGPPANSDAREKALQGIKSFEELITVKWMSREKLLLQQSVVSDHLQRLLQPKLLKLDYLNDKVQKAKDEMEKQILQKQVHETEREINDINLLPEEDLLGNRFDEHDWDKIANINFEGTRSAKELRKYWQNSEHPSINKKEWSEEEIEKLKEIAAEHKCLDWNGIAQELGTHRTAFQCLQTFQAHNKDFRRCDWTPEEDRMLLQLVQEMRVGNHIPYRKIAYYMEGRDSAQLLYRWTKRVDPRIRRGAWTPKEDALLLKAVAKYGERDWYKIRTEVPGRNDIQCRERYLNALHYDIKKGKWSAAEERKLIELTEKYGVGHWAKIASELPHRSGTQCLSKWKGLIGYRRNKRKRKESKRHQTRKHVSRPIPIFSESSSEESDLELEDDSTEEEAPKAQKVKARAAPWSVPCIDMWVPTRTNLSERGSGEVASWTVLSKGFDVLRPVQGALLIPEDHHVGKGLVDLDSRTSGPAETGMKEKLAEEDGRNSINKKDTWRVSLAYVKRVLRSNTYKQQQQIREINRRKRFAATPAADPNRALNPVAREPCRGQGRRDGMWSSTLYRRLMMAVTPWAGSRVQAWALQVKAEASRKSKVEFISQKLRTASLSSTPLFTLFIQLLHINVDGCMKVIHKRKSRQPELLKAVVGNARKAGQASPGQVLPAQSRLQTSTLPSGKNLIPLKAREGPAPASAWTYSPPGPAPKPKTVSELLREKRQREAKAKRAAQKRILLTAPQLLLPSSVIIQQPLVPSILAGSIPQAPGLPGSTSAQPLLGLSPSGASMPGVPPSQETADNSAGRQRMATEKSEKEAAPSGTKVLGSSERGKEAPRAVSSAPLSLSLQIPAVELPTLVNAESGTKEGPPYTAPTLCAPAPLGSQQNPVHVMPTLVATPSGSSAVSQQILPITWVLTPQGLIPMTLVSIPNQGKLPTATGVPGTTAEASGLKTPAVKVAPLPAELKRPLPEAGSQGLAPCRLPNEGSSPQMAIVPPPPLQLSSATSRESQSSLPTTGLLVAPSEGAQPSNSSKNSSGLNLTHQNQILGNAATPGVANNSSASAVQDSSTAPLPSAVQDSSTAPLPSAVQDSSTAPLPSAVQDSSTAPLLSAVQDSSTAPLPSAVQDSSTAPLPSAVQDSSTAPLPSAVQDSSTAPLPSAVQDSSTAPLPSAVQDSSTAPLPSAVQDSSTAPLLSAVQDSNTAPLPSAVQDSSTSPLPRQRQKKVTPDYSLILPEEEAVVKEWLQGGRGPPLETYLPLLPPFLCSLKTLSALLLNKDSLERSAAQLVTPEGEHWEDDHRPDPAALRTAVHQRLKDNPAYQLLKARFLAAFTFPAALAVLPPSRVTTTFSTTKGSSSSSSSSSEEDVLLSSEEEGCDEAGGESNGTADTGLGRGADAGEGHKEPCTDQHNEPTVRRSTRLRNRTSQP